MEVLVYVDDGVVDRSRAETPRALAEIIDTDVHPIRSVDRTFFSRAGWEQTTGAIVMPGGRDLPYHVALRGEPNGRIRRFVETGGTYIGFCAGGYFGAQQVEFDRGQPLEVVGSRELRFFPGIAAGPAYGPGTFAYDTDAGARAALVRWSADAKTELVTPIFFNGGCTFCAAESFAEIEVIGRYGELPGEPAALVACRVGNGVAVLSGVHPEFSSGSLRGGSDHLSVIADVLEPYEQARRALLRAMLERTRLCLRDYV
jgi:biotin--protein ligase